MWVVASRWIEAMLFAAALAALFIERQIVASLRRAEALRRTMLSFVERRAPIPRKSALEIPSTRGPGRC